LLLFHLYYGFNHFLRRNLSITLCAWNLLVTKKCGYGIYVNALIQQLHSKGMAETVEGDVLADFCLANPSFNVCYKNAFCQLRKHLPPDFGVPNFLIAARVRGNCILTSVFLMQNFRYAFLPRGWYMLSQRRARISLLRRTFVPQCPSWLLFCPFSVAYIYYSRKIKGLV